MPLRVDWVIPCQGVKSHDFIVDMENAGWSRISFFNFPASGTFNLVVRVAGERDEGKQYTLSVSILDDHGDPVGEVLEAEIEFEPEPADMTSGFQGRGSLIALEAVVPFARPGIYTISAWVDGSPYRLPILVAQKPGHEEFERFRDLAQKIIAVPKDGIS